MVTISGSVSGQAAPKQKVTITVYEPGKVDPSKPTEVPAPTVFKTLTAETNAAQGFSLPVDAKDLPPGRYLIGAHIDADESFAPADTRPVPFVVGVRNLTVKVDA